MNVMKKISLAIIFTVLILFGTQTFAKVSNGWSKGIYGSGIADKGGNSNTNASKAVYTIWGTIRFGVQVLSIGGIIYAGVRYMFTSADQKAEVKKSLGTLAIGAALVFGATLIIQFIQDVAGQVLVIT